VGIHVASVVDVHTLSIKNLEFVASASVKWRTVANFLALQKQAGRKNLTTKQVLTEREETGSRKAIGHV
jgi:hypothetical protein